jgi:hypothetical protein
VAVPVDDWPASILYHLLMTFWTLTAYFIEKAFIKYIANILPAVDAVSTAASATNKSEDIAIEAVEFQEIRPSQHSYFVEQFPVYSFLSYLIRFTNSDKSPHFKCQPSALLDKCYCCGNLAAGVAADRQPVWLIIG